MYNFDPKTSHKVMFLCDEIKYRRNQAPFHAADKSTHDGLLIVLVIPLMDDNFF